MSMICLWAQIKYESHDLDIVTSQTHIMGLFFKRWVQLTASLQDYNQVAFNVQVFGIFQFCLIIEINTLPRMVWVVILLPQVWTRVHER